MSETSLRAVQETKVESFKKALEHVPAQKWPDQIHYLADGTMVRQPVATKYKLGNPDTVVAPHRERFLDSIQNNLAVVGRSPTGTGKTTELTIYAMESGYFDQIVVTQPRVVAARSTTQYERSKLAPVIGEELAQQAIGWHTAPDSDYDEVNNLITNLTDGIPVQQLMAENPTGYERTLLIIDEVHEDKTNMHLLMMRAKQLNLHVLLLSATVDVNQKAAYFADEEGTPAPIIDIEGRTYPITERDYFATPQRIDRRRQPRPNGSTSVVKNVRKSSSGNESEVEAKPMYREGYSAAADYANQGLDILIFVPDIKDIHRIIAKLRDRVPASYTLLGLHSEQTPDEQGAALADYPGGKIVVATDIAMTSLTPNVDVVLDSAMSRRPQLNAGVDGLAILPSSRAARDQRRGRCGRTKPGIYEVVQIPGYPTPISYDDLDEYDEPEIVSKRPDEVLMKLGRMGLSSCAELMMAPDGNEVELAVKRLRRLGAIGLDGYSLTGTGEQMVGLSLDAPGARMLVETYNYSQSLQRQMAAALMVRQANGIHSQNMNMQYVQRLSKERDADMLVGLDLFIEAMKMTEDERQVNNIVEQKYQRALTAYETLSKRLDLDPFELTPPTDVERAQLHACMISGVDQVFIAKSKGRYSDGVHKLRRKAQDSRIWIKPGDLVAGVPYDIGRVSQQGYSTARTVSNAFRVDIDSLREFVPERIEDRKRVQKFRLNKDGVVEEQYAVYFDGRPIHKYYWQVAESSIDTREYLLESVLDESFEGVGNLPSSIQRLRHELDEIRQLQHRTSTFLDIDAKIARMKEIIRNQIPVDTTALQDVPSFKIEQHESLVSDEARQAILEQAPDTLTLFNEQTQQFIDVAVTYVDNAAYITLPKELYPLLAADIPQLQGRRVMVRPLNGHRYLDQVEAYSQRASRRDSRGTISASNDVQRRRAERANEYNSSTPTSQINAGEKRKQVSYRRSGRPARRSAANSAGRLDINRT